MRRCFEMVWNKSALREMMLDMLDLIEKDVEIRNKLKIIIRENNKCIRKISIKRKE
jgi:hypothetical protein